MKLSLVVLFFAFSLYFVRPTSAGALECSLCQFIVGQAEKFLAENATDTEILQKIEDACEILKDPTWVSDCKNIVQEYGEELIQKVIAKEPPKQACTEVGLCSNQTRVAIAPKKIVQKIQKPQNVQGEIECTVCQYIVQAVEGYIADNKTEAEILQELEKDCAALKVKSWIDTCNGTIATFGPQIIKLVLEKQPAAVVCKEVDLCKNTTIQTKPAPVHINVVPAVAGNDTLECTLCEYLVSWTEQLVEQNKTETEIIGGLEDVCNALPIKDWATACNNIVVEYGDIIIAYIVNEQPADVVCTEIKLCTKTPLRLPIPIKKH